LQSIDAIITEEKKKKKDKCSVAFILLIALAYVRILGCLLMIQDKYYDDRPLVLSWSMIRSLRWWWYMNVVHTLIEHHVCFDLEIQSAGRLQSIWFNYIQDARNTSTIPHTKMIKRSGWSLFCSPLFESRTIYTFIHESKKEN